MSPPKDSPFVFGPTHSNHNQSSSLSRFFFTFLSSPFKSLAASLSPSSSSNTSPARNPTPTPNSNSNPNPNPVTINSSGSSDSKNSIHPSPDPPNPAPPQDRHPHLHRSISHSPIVPQNNHWLPSSASSPALNHSLPRRPLLAQPSRTFYLGPGHSLMNNSTRLSLARRKRLAHSKPISLLRSGYDVLPSPSPSPSHCRSLPVSLTQPEPKRQRLAELPSQSTHSKHSPPTVADGEPTTAHPPPSSIPLSSQPPRRASWLAPSSLTTPVRPSPLRNVTVPSPTLSPSPAKSDVGSKLTSTKRAKRTMASSIISSVMKEVDAELSSKTPSSSPIKPADVINPYADFARPCRRLPTTTKPSASLSEPPIEISTQQKELRKRKLDNCLSGDSPGQGITVLDEPVVRRSKAEEILERTMPREYRLDHGQANGEPKSRRVGQLPERVLRKQRQKRKTNGSETEPSPIEPAPPPVSNMTSGTLPAPQEKVQVESDQPLGLDGATRQKFVSAPSARLKSTSQLPALKAPSVQSNNQLNTPSASTGSLPAHSVSRPSAFSKADTSSSTSSAICGSSATFSVGPKKAIVPLPKTQSIVEHPRLAFQSQNAEADRQIELIKSQVLKLNSDELITFKDLTPKEERLPFQTQYPAGGHSDDNLELHKQARKLVSNLRVQELAQFSVL